MEAWNAIRGWAERKARLLGLDAPAKHQFLTMDMIDAEVKRLQVELGILDVPDTVMDHDRHGDGHGGRR